MVTFFLGTIILCFHKVNFDGGIKKRGALGEVDIVIRSASAAQLAAIMVLTEPLRTI